MRGITLISAVGFSIAAALGVSPASATTFSNESSWNGTDAFLPIGNDSYGETFNAPGGVLSSFGFMVDTAGATGDVKLVLSDWDGTKPIGPAIYTSAEFALNSTPGMRWNIVNGINAPLTLGQSYIAYFTVVGVVDPIANPVLARTADDGGLGGMFSFHSSAPPQNWQHEPFQANLVYKAEFDVAKTPIPGTLPLLASALTGLGFVGWRRKKAEAS